MGIDLSSIRPFEICSIRPPTENYSLTFLGQYGGLSEDISCAISPYLKGERVDFSSASDSETEGIIRLIRAKLMP
jgi:hypothetical protein